MTFMHLKRCVEHSPIVPIPQQWLDSIDARIPPSLKESPESKQLLDELFQEISDDFHNVMVKHTGIISVFSCL